MTFTWVDSLTPPELKSVTNLHQKALGGSFLTRFGPKFLSTVYLKLIESPENHTLVVKSNGKIIGFLIVVSNLKRQFPGMVTTSLIVSVLHHPIVIFQIVQYLIQNHPKTPQFELQFIAVNMKFRNKGIGTNMLKHLAKRLNYKSYIVGTKMDNLTSNSFYQKKGFIFSHQQKFFGDIFNYYSSPA